jgi:hypothetical protein
MSDLQGDLYQPLEYDRGSCPFVAKWSCKLSGGRILARKPDREELQQTLLRLAKPKMSPKELLKETKKLHPEAGKKDIVRAAFASLIAVADQDGEKALVLQDFALKERGPGEEG